MRKGLALCFSLILLISSAPQVNATTEAFVYSTQNLGYNQSVIARTLQAYANDSQAELFFDTPIWGYTQTPQKWMDYYSNVKGYNFSRINTMEDMLKKYKNKVKGLAVYDSGTDAARWIAETYSGIYDCLPVSADFVDVAFQDNFSLMNGWSLGGDGGQNASSNGDYMTLSTGPEGNHASIYRNLTVNVDTHPYIQLDVKSITPESSWYIAVYADGQTYWLPSWSTSTGFYICDLRQVTGWTGTKTMQLSIGVQGGNNKTVVVDWVKVGKYGFADNFWELTGWSGGNSNGGTVTCDGESATISTGPNLDYNLIYRDIGVNLDDYSYALINVSASKGNWHLAIYDGNTTYRLYPPQPGMTGQFIWQIGKNTGGKRWKQNFQLQIVVDGGPNKDVTVDWVRIGRNPSEEGNFINSFPTSIDLRTMNWADDITAYNWAMDNLLPLTDKSAGYCVGDTEYASDDGRWQAPSLDIAIKNKAFCFRLPPTMNDTQKADLFDDILSKLSPPAAIYGGWSETFTGDAAEQTFVQHVSAYGHYAILSTGSNGTFHTEVPVDAVSFNQQRNISKGPVESSRYYIAFMTAEGDTFAAPNDFYDANWVDSGRGTVPINWSWNPLHQEKYKGMAEYYRNTATSNDYFFSSIPLGYSFIAEMPNLTQFADFSRTYFDLSNIAVSDKWDRGIPNMEANKNYSRITGISALFDGIMNSDAEPGVMPGAQLRTLENGVPYITPAMELMYVSRNPDGSPLTPQGLAQLITAEAQKHEKPYFLKVYINTYRIGSEFDQHLPTKLKETSDLLGNTDYKVVKLDEFVSALKTATAYQDDFAYKSVNWEYGGSNNGVSMIVNSGQVTLSNGPADTWGLMTQTVNADVSQTPYFQINVTSFTGGAWSLAIADKYGSGQTYYLPANTGTGTYSYDIRDYTGWEGLKKFDLQIHVQGENTSLKSDWVRITSILN